MRENPDASRVYTRGDLRAVLRERFEARARRHHQPAEQDRAASQARAVAAGEAVEVTFHELKSALWHAGLANAAELEELRSRWGGGSVWLIEADGTTYTPIVGRA